MPLHDGVVVVMEIRFVCNNYGTHDNETTLQHALQQYQHNCTIELAPRQPQNAQKQPISNIGHCRHRHGRCCCVSFFEFLGAALHMRAKWSVLRRVFSVTTTTTTAPKHDHSFHTHKHKHKHKHKHQHNDDHQTSHHLNDDKTRNDNNKRCSCHSGNDNDNNPPQASI